MLVGCGGHATKQPPRAQGPRLPRATAQQLASLSDAAASALAARSCDAPTRVAALQAATLRAINAHRIPPEFQEELLGAVNDLAGRSSVCVRVQQTGNAPAPRGGGKHKPKHVEHKSKHGDESGD